MILKPLYLPEMMIVFGQFHQASASIRLEKENLLIFPSDPAINQPETDGGDIANHGSETREFAELVIHRLGNPSSVPMDRPGDTQQGRSRLSGHKPKLFPRR
jgi:hypothetical protein